MDFTQFMAVLATGLGVISTIIGLVNSKSKSDKADAIQMRSLEMKIDNLLEKIAKMEQDMYSVVHIGNQNSQQILVLVTKVESLEGRMSKAELEIDALTNDGK